MDRSRRRRIPMDQALKAAGRKQLNIAYPTFWFPQKSLYENDHSSGIASAKQSRTERKSIENTLYPAAENRINDQRTQATVYFRNGAYLIKKVPLRRFRFRWSRSPKRVYDKNGWWARSKLRALFLLFIGIGFKERFQSVRSEELEVRS